MDKTVIPLPDKKWQAVLYMRLSKEDGESDESASITNQRELLLSYVHKYLPDVTVVSEKSDDGFSGASFQRPRFIEMMRDIRAGKINCVIVKDISRLGRNFIDVSDLIEREFPRLSVRFISVNDGFDTQAAADADLTPALKTLVYSFYSKDISRKVRASLKTRMAKGEFTGARAPYGYVRYKNRLKADPEAAAVVRDIFLLALEGLKAGKIAELLNNNGILSPAGYKNRTKENSYKPITSYWSNCSVMRILRDARYTGTAVGGKRKRLEPGRGYTVPCKEDEIIVVDNAHEGIIGKNEFDAVQKLLPKHAAKKRGKSVGGLLSRKVRCGGCGRCLVRRGGKTHYYTCGLTNRTNGCFKGKLDETVIYSIIGQVLKSLPGISPEEEAHNIIEQISGSAHLRKTFESSGRLRAKRAREKNYELFAQGKLSKEQYLELKRKEDHKDKALVKEADSEKFKPHNELSGCGNTSGTLLSDKMGLGVLLKSIYASEDRRVEIVWNFADVFK